MTGQDHGFNKKGNVPQANGADRLELVDMLVDRSITHYELPQQERDAADSKRCVPVFDLMTLVGRARAGRIRL